MVSALHHEGRRLHELAREGITVKRDAREIQIDRLEVLGFVPGSQPIATLEITCSTGTYIRTLAADLGAVAETGALMQSLRRTWVGSSEADFNLQGAYSLEDLQSRAEAGTLHEAVLPLHRALHSWRHIRLDEAQTARLRNGQAIALEELPDYADLPTEAELLAAVQDAQGEVIAVAHLITGHLRPVKVLT